MFQNFIISIEAVAPMFLIMAIGIWVRKLGLLHEQEAKRLNKLVFHVFFPPLMFSNLYGAQIGNAFHGKLIAFSVIMVLLAFAATTAIVMKIEKSNQKRGAMIQAIYRSNFVIMGIPVVSNIFGGENLATTAVAITVIVPLYNILAVVVLEIFRGGRPSIGHIMKGICTNPLIIGAVLGALTIPLRLELPTFLESTLFSMKEVATPMALLVLGASLNRKSLEESKRNLTICLLGRLVIVPALALTIGAAIGLRDVAFVTLIAIFASPTAVSSYTMAEQMDSDGQLAGNCVVFSSALSSITLFGWIFVFKTMGMF